MEAWGFEYKTCAFVWIKKNRKSDTNFWGMGAYTRANAEICLLGVTPGFKAADRVKSYVLSAPLDYCMRIPYRAEQVWLAIRHALAWHDNPKGDYTVQYDKPLNRSDQPQPMVQLYEAPTEGKSVCDGKCAKCGRR